MPSIEIICIDQIEPILFKDLPFQVDVGKELISHRGPTPLFQEDFDHLAGCIYHLLENQGMTAYELLSWDWDTFPENENRCYETLAFSKEIHPHVQSMLSTLLNASPVKQILFTSDYQFGPELAKRFGLVPFSKFWGWHDASQIRLNAAYWITEDKSSSADGRRQNKPEES